MTDVDIVVIGGGPAGLSAALNLVRARRSVLVVDGNRPRNAATLASHGFLTRDGISPLELRRLGREEFEGYPGASFAFGLVSAVSGSVADGFTVAVSGIRGEPDRSVTARAVVVATGLAEVLPAIEGLRAYYGTWLHSCVECDGYEKADAALALIGETDDLTVRALELAQWSGDLVVFTNGVGVVSADDEALLSSHGIVVEREPIAELVGERAVLTGVRLASGRVVAREAGFVRPVWMPQAAFLDGLGVALDEHRLVAVDPQGRTSVAGVYAAGDVTAPGPQQLIVAAGDGANVALWVNRDLLGPFWPRLSA